MGTIKRFKRSRAIPNAIGIPEYGFELYNFPKMKKLPMSLYSVDLTLPFQPVFSIYVEPNAWNFYKQLFIKFGYTVNRTDTGSPPNLDFSTWWQVNSDTPFQIWSNNYGFPNPYIKQGYAPGNLVRLGDIIYDLAGNLQTSEPGFFGGASVQNYFNCSDPAVSHPVSDPMTITLLAQANFAVTGDSIQPVWGTAYVESPLDLRRINQ